MSLVVPKYRVLFNELVADGYRPPISPVKALARNADITIQTAYRWWKAVKKSEATSFCVLERVRPVLFPLIDADVFFDKYTREVYVD